MDVSDPSSEPNKTPETDPPEKSNANLPKLICFDELARCGEEVWIVNRGDLYRLRRTKQGKLILTK